jgi:hypothetical protein
MDIADAWKVIAIMSFVGLLVTIVYIFLLKWITKPILYISLVFILIFGLLAGYYAYLKVEEYKDTENEKYALAGAIFIWSLTALYLLFLCCNCHNIRLGASIMVAASDYIDDNKRIVLLPLISYLFCLPVFAWWTISTVYLYTVGTATFKENSFIADIVWDANVKEMLWLMLFGLLWVVSFFLALQSFIIAVTVCMWYYSKGSDEDDPEARGSSVSTSVWWAVRYHMGSIAFGSFLIAVVTMIQIVFEYFAKKTEKLADTNVVYKMIICYVRYYIWCLDKYVKFINKNAYIQIALHNVNFCKAAW